MIPCIIVRHSRSSSHLPMSINIEHIHIYILFLSPIALPIGYLEFFLSVWLSISSFFFFFRQNLLESNNEFNYSNLSRFSINRFNWNASLSMWIYNKSNSSMWSMSMLLIEFIEFLFIFSRNNWLLDEQFNGWNSTFENQWIFNIKWKFNWISSF